MTQSQELQSTIHRIANNAHTDADLQVLRQIFGSSAAIGRRSVAIGGNANGATIATGDGNVILNITFQADRIQVGDKIYQGDGVEILRARSCVLMFAHRNGLSLLLGC